MVQYAAFGKVPVYINGGVCTEVVGIEDVAEAFLLAAEHGRTGERYIISETYMPMRDMLTTAATAVGGQAAAYRNTAARRLCGGLGGRAGRAVARPRNADEHQRCSAAAHHGPPCRPQQGDPRTRLAPAADHRVPRARGAVLHRPGEESGHPMTEADLVEIEAIKQLKARYCRLLDTKDWSAWRTLFADDFVSDTTQAGGKRIEGADEFVAFTRKSLRDQATVHQVHAPPEIELTSATAARGGVWALEDVVRFGPRRQPARVRSLPRDLREDRRSVALREFDADPVARGDLQRPCRGVHLRSVAQGHVEGIRACHEVTAQDRRNSSRSALMTSWWVTNAPCG